MVTVISLGSLRRLPLVLLSLMVVILGLVIHPLPALAGTVTLAPTDDTYTTRGNASATHGGEASVNVNAGASTERRTHLRFNVTSIPAGATGVTATLKLYAQQGAATSVTFTVSSEANAWTEGALTWNNQPVLGSTVTSRTGLTNGAYNTWNLSSVITGNGIYAFALQSSSTTQMYFNSKENAANKPQLVLSWTDPSSGSAPSVTTGTASGVTAAAATLTGTVNPNGAATTCHFDWGTTTAYGQSTANDSSPGSGTANVNVSANLTGLSANTPYYFRLACSNSVGTTNGAAGNFTTGAAGVPLSVAVSGNRLVDGSGNTVQLRGVNRSGTQYACSEGWGIFDGPSDNASLDAMKTWHVNAVRVSLNDACWLGINGVPAAYGGTNYQNAITDYVNRITAKGMYAIVDLHWANPGTTLQTDQVPMASRDHANTFWSGVANTFKTNPAVLFDLFNEPFPDSNQNTAAAWACVRDGGTCPGVSYTAAGSQEMLNAIRSAGANNVVMVGGPQYAGVVYAGSPSAGWTTDQWTAYKPTDSAGQLAASIHIYFNTPASPEWSPCYKQSCWDSSMAPLATTTPVVIGEFGEHDCAYGLLQGTSLSPTQQDLLIWSDSHGVSYLGWTWFAGNCAGEPALISDYAGTPTAFGAGVKSHFLLFP